VSTEGLTAGGRRRRSAGYTLVGVVVLIAVLTILVAAIGPSITAIVQRDKERELIFRGKQLARGILAYQKRFGRFPMSLKELADAQPRMVRKLWKEPMCNCDAWQTIIVGSPEAVPPGQAPPGFPPRTTPRPGAPGSGNQPPSTYSGMSPPTTPIPGSDGGPAPAPTSAFPSLFTTPGGQTVGPIIGVRSKLHQKGFVRWRDLDYYDEWRFIAGDQDNDYKIPVDPNLLRGIHFTPVPTP
jgi:type II secretory pathway pseudopilin PulG